MVDVNPTHLAIFLGVGSFALGECSSIYIYIIYIYIIHIYIYTVYIYIYYDSIYDNVLICNSITLIDNQCNVSYNLYMCIPPVN